MSETTTTVRTEFGVRHTTRQYDRNVVVVDTAHDPTSRDQAEQLLAHILDVQAESDTLPIDAVIVTRTITVTEWAAEEPYEPGTALIHTSTRTGKEEAGWAYKGLNWKGDGTIDLEWVGSMRLMTSVGVDPADVRLDPKVAKACGCPDDATTTLDRVTVTGHREACPDSEPRTYVWAEGDTIASGTLANYRASWESAMDQGDRAFGTELRTWTETFTAQIERTGDAGDGFGSYRLIVGSESCRLLIENELLPKV